MHPLLNVAVMAARRAGSTLVKKMVNLDKLKVEQKSHNDYVSDADKAAEKAVIEKYKLMPLLSFLRSSL